MAQFMVDNGAVTSWGSSTANSDLISNGLAPASFELSMSVPENDVTVFSASAQNRAWIPGLGEWSGTITSQISPAALGANGSVTFSGLGGNISGYTLNLNANATESTVFSGSGVAWKTFLPGLFDWSGTFTGDLDDTTAIVTGASSGGTIWTLGGATASLVLKLLDEGTTDHTFTGNAYVTQASPSIRIGEKAGASYNFRGTSNLTAAGQTAGNTYTNPFEYDITNNTGVIQRPAADPIVLTADTGRTYEGSAFWTSIAISCAVDQPITVTVGFRGSGALDIN